MFFDIAYGFSVPESKGCLIDLTIESAWRVPDVQFQIHKMGDNTIRMFERRALLDRDLLRLILKTKNRLGISGNHLSLEETFSIPAIREELQLQCPIKSKPLPHEICELTAAICSSEIPSDVEKPCGFDGHNYCFRIYKPCKPCHQTFNCWCRIPKEWEPLERLVSFLVEESGLDPKYYGPLKRI